MTNASWCRQLGRRLLMYLQMRGIFQLDITECKIVNRFGMHPLWISTPGQCFFGFNFCDVAKVMMMQKKKKKKKPYLATYSHVLFLKIK
jgi:hypothetical protein